MSIDKTYLNIKAMYDKPTANDIINGEMLKILQDQEQTNGLLSLLLFNIVLRVLVTAIREEKEIRGIQIGKEELKQPFAIGMIVYIENSKDTTRKLLELINEFSKVVGCKINIQIYASFI